MNSIYDTLLAPTSDGMGVQPGLATKWGFSADGKTLSLTLREGVNRLINLSYVDRDPTRAARIVNAFGDAFIASQLERKFGQTAYARQFLQSRLEATKKTLETSEAAVVNYAQSQGIVMVGQAGTGGAGEGPGSSGSGGGTSLEGSSM
eukprot:gene51155-69624_t